MPRTGAYRMLRIVLADLRRAERALTMVEPAAPDEERARYLEAIRAAIAQLERRVPRLPEC